MVTLVPMGYGVTDENGVAKLDHDMDGNVLSHSYTGVGAGRIDLLASIDDPDNVSYSGEGTLVSEIYEVLDCIFYDDGLSGTNTKWDILFVQKSLENNGTKFLCTTTNASSRASMNPLDNSSVFDFDPQPMIFECELVDFSTPSGNIGMQYLQTGGSPNKQINFQSSDIGHIIRLEYDGTTLTKYVDDVAQANPLTVTYTDKIRVGFSFYAQEGYIIVKNVKAYPI